MSTSLILTWPKSRPLQSYLDELAKAVLAGDLINYRVRTRPNAEVQRCYMVHDGAVRGWNKVVEVAYREAGQVARVESDAFAGFWPAGWYVVRDPEWHEIEPVPMQGFRGFRYACPTCGGVGPDTIYPAGDYGGGPYEANCGDEFHDQWEAKAA